MNRGNLVVLLLFLTGGVALGAVYRWVDDTGRVHFGDSPPPESDVQSVPVPEGPTQEEVERAGQQMQEKMEKYKGLSEDINPPETPDESSPHEQTPPATFDNVDCFSALSGIVAGPSAETDTPITATTLTTTQRENLIGLFERMAGSWQGTITDLTCMGNPSDPKRKITNYDAKTRVDWDAHTLRLVIETDSVGARETHTIERLFQRFEVGDVLYFSDYKQSGTISLKGNEVEVLDITKDTLSFIIKRRIPGSRYARIPRVEVRYLEISRKRLKEVELYYSNKVLTGSRAWVLD